MFKVIEVVEERDAEGRRVLSVVDVCEAPCLAELMNAIEDSVFRDAEAKRKAAAQQYGTEKLRAVHVTDGFTPIRLPFGDALVPGTPFARLPDPPDDADDDNGDDPDDATPIHQPDAVVVHPHLWSDAVRGH